MKKKEFKELLQSIDQAKAIHRGSCEVAVRSSYRQKEWKKIKKLALEEGKTFSSLDDVKRFLKNA